MDGFCFLTFTLCCVFTACGVYINKLDDASCWMLVRASFYTSKARGTIYLHDDRAMIGTENVDTRTIQPKDAG